MANVMIVNVDTALEYGRWFCAVGLLAANVAVWRGVYLENEKFPEETKDAGWKLLLIGLAAEAAIGFALFSIDTAISIRQQLVISTAASEIERLKSENLAFEKILLPRRVFVIPKEKYFLINDLDKFKGTPVMLQVVPDFEAKVLANDIFAVLTGSGWVVQYVDSTGSNLEPQSISEGVSVHTNKASIRPYLANSGSSAGNAVASWLDGANVNPTGVPHWEDLSPWNGTPGYLKFNAPDNVVLVTVGMKPVAAMLGRSSFTINVVNPNNPIK
jgi:hypothetical protein